MSTFIIFLILIVIVAFLLVVVIMVQNPKGGGLSSTFGGGSGTQIGGVKQTGDFLDKSTWFLATALIVLILASNLTVSQRASTESKALDQTEETTSSPAPVVPGSTNDDATTDSSDSNE